MASPFAEAEAEAEVPHASDQALHAGPARVLGSSGRRMRDGSRNLIGCATRVATRRGSSAGAGVATQLGWNAHYVFIHLLAAAAAGVAAGQVMETPAYLQRALALPLRQDVFTEAGILLVSRV